MAVRDATRHVRLLDAEDREVPLAFVDVEGGLWDPGRTRLTLLFHPGRVKRGVAPGERMGPPLRAGHEYRLVVDAAMADAAGVPLGRPFEHRFRAEDADRVPPRAEGVAVDRPAGPSAPVAVRLPEPLDHALLARWIWVEDAQGRRVEGHGEARDRRDALDPDARSSVDAGSLCGPDRARAGGPGGQPLRPAFRPRSRRACSRRRGTSSPPVRGALIRRPAASPGSPRAGTRRSTRTEARRRRGSPGPDGSRSR